MNSSILSTKNNNASIKSLNLNFGPQHPAAHGVLRMALSLNNETIVDNDTHIGLLHRGTEKLMEKKPYLHSLPYFDRFDYVSMLMQEHAYCLAVEQLIGKTFFKKKVNHVRVLYDELTRILNHLLAIACHALDVGSMSPIFWGFEEREKIMEFYERVSGARMHAAFYRFGHNFLTDLPAGLTTDINVFTSNHFSAINEINFLLVGNKIWRQRLIGIGQLNEKQVNAFGASGVISRSAGVRNDVRVNPSKIYASYDQLNLITFLGKNGDCYDRYLIRISEIIESLSIINKVNLILKNQRASTNPLFKTNKDKVYTNMENLINHFKYWSEGVTTKDGLVATSVESAKGEFSVTISSGNNSKPNRVRVRSPAFYNLQLIKDLSIGHLLADLITLIGTLDIVFGEVDR